MGTIETEQQSANLGPNAPQNQNKEKHTHAEVELQTTTNPQLRWLSLWF